MKKLILVFASVLISLSVLSAAEPLAVASLASPAFIAIGSMGETADADSLSDDELFLLTLPERVQDSGIMLQRAFSSNPIRITGFAWDAYGIYSSREDFVPVSASGSISFAPSWNADEGRLSLGISYDDVSLSYMDGKEVATSDAGDVYYTTSEEAIEADDYGVSPGNETVYTFANVDSTKAHNFTAVLRKTGTTIGAGSFSFTTAPDSLEPPVIVPQV